MPQVIAGVGQMTPMPSWLSQQWRVAKGRFYRRMYAPPLVSIDDLAPPLPAPIEPILDHVCLPPYHGPDSHDDLTPLLRLVTHLAPQIVLEFGTGYGNMTANICAVSAARVFTVNARPDQLSGRVITYSLREEDIGSVYRRYAFQERVLQICENTLDFDPTRYFPEACVDLAIIDACHDTEYVINDFTKVLPTLSTTATVLIHDTHPSMEGHLFESYLACLELRKRGFDIKHMENTWWAIWQR